MKDMKDRIRRMSWLLPTLLVGVFAVSLLLVIHREQGFGVYREHLMQVVLMSSAVGFLVWLGVLGTTRRTRMALAA